MQNPYMEDFAYANIVPAAQSLQVLEGHGD